MPTPLEKYFAQRVKNLFNHFHDFELQGDDTSLHDLRVEMKKLTAIIKFLRQVYPEQKLKKTAHLLRSIFQAAGEIRENQLMQQWLQKKQAKVIARKYFPAKNIFLMVENFRQGAGNYKNDLKEIIDHTGNYISTTNEILADQYFTDLNAQAEKKCRKNLPANEWHELRKLIKQRIYAYNWLQHTDKNDDPLFHYYNKLQENIGTWHDLVIIKEIFSQKRIYLSQDIRIQKDFGSVWKKLTNSMKYRERQIKEMLSKKEVIHEK